MKEEEYGALWDNAYVLTVAEGALPVANPATIMAVHIVLFWMEDRDDEKRELNGGSGRSWTALPQKREPRWRYRCTTHTISNT